MSSPKITPMIKQYLSIKGQYPDAILFYRMGDFYEMFFEDAEKASKLLEITLTSRNKKDEKPVPMCGFPHKAARGYIARLIDNGCKVAICDQTEDPAEAKGLVRREVVRVITPGMIVEDELLKENKNNFILAVANDSNRIGLSYLDISTGTFRMTESNNLSDIIDETLRISPSELLFPETVKKYPLFDSIRKGFPENIQTFLETNDFEAKSGREKLLNQFRTLSLEGFGCENMKAGISAAGALLSYVHETQKQNIEHINSIETYQLDNYLWIDNLSLRNLEVIANLQDGSRNGSLLDILDMTKTAMGGRLLKNWIRYPLMEEEKIKSRLDAVEEAVEKNHIRRDLRDFLKSVHDLERLGAKITMGHSNARDLVALKKSLYMLPEVSESLSQLESSLFVLKEDDQDLQILADLLDESIREDAPPVITDGGLIKDGFSNELDEWVRISRDGKGWLANLEAKERNETGITALKVRFNKVFGYYIEVPKAKSDNVPAHYARKQTLVNAERYITDELKNFESKVLNAEEQRNLLEYKIFNQVRDEVIKNNRAIQIVAKFIAEIDCLLNFAEISDRNDYHRPEINNEGIIRIMDGRHPVVEKLITGERFVPNSLTMDNDENQVLVITGPNMAGKSTILRQVALMVLLAQMGAFVPARKASICITDRIFTRVGALDNLSQGQSTFMVEMQETANILNNSTSKSLVIMDEIGRGTSTYDGMSIAWAVAEYLHDLNNIGVKTLFATHYHELTDLSQTKKRVNNFNIAVKEWNDEIIFLRKLVKGGTNRSYGIQVARLAGIPDMVIHRAKKILGDIEIDNHAAGRSPAKGPEKQADDKKHVQLNLFQKPEKMIIEQLNRIDISRMTPLDALNYLDKLKSQIKEFLN